MSRWQWFFSELTNRLWYRSSLYGIFAVAVALVSIYAKKYVPYDLPQKIGVDALDSILNILASSMLAVTIFSLSTMVSAYSAATSNLTPRATKLLIEDKVSHSSLSTFLGTFIYSIVSIIALKTGAYGDTGRFLLFIVTIFVIILIVVTLLRWIEYLSRMGRVGETILTVEHVAARALKQRLEKPFLGGERWLSPPDILPEGSGVFIDSAKYVRHIDMGLLAEIAKDQKAQIYVASMPGKLAHPAYPLAVIKKEADQQLLAQIRKAFITGDERSFPQDPRFGLDVLSEIAIRALSPAINDPGTALSCMASATRILLLWRTRKENTQAEIDYPGVFVRPLYIDDLCTDFFAPIARDGAANFELGVRLQKTLMILHDAGPDDMKVAARKLSALALEYAVSSLTIDRQKQELTGISL